MSDSVETLLKFLDLHFRFLINLSLTDQAWFCKEIMNKYFPIFFLLISFTCYYPQNDKGLIGKFTFNTANAVNEINGKQVKTSSVLLTEDRFGNPRLACYLHGSPGSYINLGSGPDLKPSKGTVSLWIKIDIAMLGGKGMEFNPIIIAKNKNEDDFWEAYHLSYDYNSKKTVAVTTQSERLQVQLYSNDTLTLRTWHQLALTFDDDTLSYYIDGSFNAKIIKKFRTVYSETDSVMVGNVSGKKNQRFLCGSVDDILVYNRVLSPNEILDLYNAPDPNQFNHYLNFILKILGLAAIIGIVTWIIIRRHKIGLLKEIEKNRINARLNELETRAIRAQMNPHFIFNSLNTLQRFILEEDNANAHLYLTRFSELLRKILESSSADSISLKEEIEILTSYIEIEKLRFGDSFDFVICSEIQDAANIFIPLMLIQPLVENAIWHGLLPKENNQLLKINFRDISDTTILCQIDDNGVGRSHSYEQKHVLRKKSLALDFIKQRLEILEKATGTKGSLKITDKKNEAKESLGTQVDIIIPKIK